MTADRSEAVQDALMLVADWNWRKGPRRKAALAWLLGRRERFRTHLGDDAKIAWWRGSPYLIRLKEVK
ncbi:MAG: hypothetical protein N4A53_08165 [Pelagimonas sp.]|jgi:hypothetical protein|nr:hypothetical protein [Pelagimonas sp.]